MSGPEFEFGGFRLDPANRMLSRDGRPIELSGRYLDCLILLVRANGDLVTREHFMADVWRNIPVTDEALSQAIRTLRRALSDSAATPRFIETVPKHGYRFIAPVKRNGIERTPRTGPGFRRQDFISLSLAGSRGAILAGAIVGLLYGLVGATALSPQGGALSLVLMMVLITSLAAGIAGLGISAGVAASGFIERPGAYWSCAGGALGGLIVGAFGNLVGQDAFRLLLGRSLEPFTGALEGLVVGAFIGAAAPSSHNRHQPSLLMASLVGILAGTGITLAGGKLMAGSLIALANAFPESSLSADRIGDLIGGEPWRCAYFLAVAAIEGAVFATAIVWSMRRERAGATAIPAGRQ